MKKTLMMILFIALAISMMWGQGLEDFSNCAATASYLDGSFVGNGEITWTYGHSRNVDTYPIDGNGLMLRRASDSYLQATIPGGIGNFSFEYRKAYTGTAVRQLEVIVNGTQVATSPEFGTISGEETDVYTLTVEDVNLAGNVIVKIKNVGTTATNRQTILDNISWTGYASSSPTIVLSKESLSGFSYVHNSGPSAEQTFTVSGTNLTEDISIAAPTNYEISTNSDSGYASSLSFAPSDGTVSATTVYVRLKAGLGVGTYNSEVITASSSGATNVTVTCSGEVTTPPAPNAPVATATAITSSGFTANWNAVAGATSYEIDVYTKSEATATDLFISEYVEGTSFIKGIEIYNGSGAAIDLSAYSLKKQTNGAGDFGNELVLSGALANNDVYVIVYSSASTGDYIIGDMVDLYTSSGALTFNGNDAVALYHNGTQIDVVGIVDQVSPNWGADVTLVRKASVTSPTPAYSIDDWDVYPVNTLDYLGYHTMGSMTFVTGYENNDAGNVTQKAISELNPETTYYYVVRAIDAYDQSSANSNEISVTTTEAYDYPNGESITDQGVSVVITGGNVNAGTMEIPPVANTGFVPTAQFVFVLDSTVSYTITIQTSAAYGAYFLDSKWNRVIGTGSEIVFTIEPAGAKGEIEVPIILGDQDPTLPIELSAFTATMSAQNYVNLMWTTQSETNVRGFYVYRSVSDALESSELVSPMIGASNTSTQQSYIYVDPEIYTDGMYYYWLENVDFDGSSAFHGPISINVSLGGNNDAPGVPIKTALSAVYPNPFNPSAWVSFGIARPADVRINIYNARGQLVRSLLNENRGIGYHRIKWDGKDDLGSNCSTGIYYIRMQADADSFVRKALLMK